MTLMVGLTLFGFELPLPVAVLGLIVGTTYGLLGIGLVLVYRANGVVNFAHGQIGAFAAAFFTILTLRWSLPYPVAFAVAVVIGAGIGALCEVVVVRRLRTAPRVMTIVATLGVGQLLASLAAALAVQRTGTSFPQPPGFPVFDVGALRITRAQSAMLLVAPVLVAALAVFMRRTRLGVAMRAAAANADAARLSAISPARMSGVAWALAGALSTFTALLVAPSLGDTTGAGFGPSLLLRALAVAVIAGMTRIWVAVLAGLCLGLLEQLVAWNSPNDGAVEVVLFVTVLAALAIAHRAPGRSDDRGAWASVSGLPTLPAHVAAHPAVRRWRLIGVVLAVLVVVALPIVVSNAASITLVTIVAVTIVGMSVGLLTGLAGQLSLGQFGVAAVGATVSYRVAAATGSFALAIPIAGIAGAAVGLAVGLPALRNRGLMLAVGTLAFALAVPAWLLPRVWMLGDGVDPGRPVVFGRTLDSGKEYYIFAVVVGLAIVVLCGNLRRSGFGRVLTAVRDNEQNARAFGIPVETVKAQAFALAGFVAGVGGAVFGHALTHLSPTPFAAADSIDAVVTAVIGGVGLLVGPLLGALYLIGVPAFLPLDAAGLAATRFGALVLLLYLPGGIGQLARPLRDRIVSLIMRSTPDALREASTVSPGVSALPRVRANSGKETQRTPRAGTPGGHPVLEVVGLTKRFGGVLAVDDVSFTVPAHQVVGLIGPNGAGKSTLFEIVTGFTRPNSGTVRLAGRDVSAISAHGRAQLGLVRSFQDGALFPTLTVRATIGVALERERPSRLPTSILGLRRAERDRHIRTDELLHQFGLLGYQDVPIRELSTGTRRIVELACAVALRPEVLLLDEPAAGVAQREVEALGRLLRRIASDLGLTMVVIEHDIPMVSQLADRLMVMDLGRVVADGDPDAVMRDPVVADAYLGGHVEAVGRSDLVAPGSSPDPPTAAATKP